MKRWAAVASGGRAESEAAAVAPDLGHAGRAGFRGAAGSGDIARARTAWRGLWDRMADVRATHSPRGSAPGMRAGHASLAFRVCRS
eukprot:222070-Alexandrium_andersonii.AAC.1